jgi:hypothetical protein
MPHGALSVAGMIRAKQGMRDGELSSRQFSWMQFVWGFARNVEEKRRAPAEADALL